MIYRDRKKTGWKIALGVIMVAALLSCGLLIALDVRKVAAEKKSEQKFPREKTMSKTAETLPFPTPRDSDN